MKTTPAARKRAPGAGRKPLVVDGRQRTIRARVTQAQYEKWDAMANASAWLRRKLDAVKPTKTGPTDE